MRFLQETYKCSPARVTTFFEDVPVENIAVSRVWCRGSTDNLVSVMTGLWATGAGLAGSYEQKKDQLDYVSTDNCCCWHDALRALVRGFAARAQVRMFMCLRASHVRARQSKVSCHTRRVHQLHSGVRHTCNNKQMDPHMPHEVSLRDLEGEGGPKLLLVLMWV